MDLNGAEHDEKTPTLPRSFGYHHVFAIISGRVAQHLTAIRDATLDIQQQKQSQSPPSVNGHDQPVPMITPTAIADVAAIDNTLGWRQQIDQLLQIFLIAIDASMLALAFVIGYYARARLPIPELPIEAQPPLREYLPMMAIHTITIIAFFYIARMYHMKRAINRFDLGVTIAQNVSIGTFAAVAVETLSFKNSGFALDYPRGVIIYAWLFSIVLIVLGRELHRQLVIMLRKLDIGRDQLLIVGAPRMAERIMAQIDRFPQLGYDVVGLLEHKSSHRQVELDGKSIPVFDDYSNLPTIIDQYGVKQVIIALPDATRHELVTIVTLCQRGTVDIKIFPRYIGLYYQRFNCG